MHCLKVKCGHGQNEGPHFFVFDQEKHFLVLVNKIGDQANGGWERYSSDGRPPRCLLMQDLPSRPLLQNVSQRVC